MRRPYVSRSDGCDASVRSIVTVPVTLRPQEIGRYVADGKGIVAACSARLAPSVVASATVATAAMLRATYSLLPDTEFPHKLDWMYEVDYRSSDLTPHQQETLTTLRIRNRQQLAALRSANSRYQTAVNVGGRK